MDCKDTNLKSVNRTWKNMSKNLRSNQFYKPLIINIIFEKMLTFVVFCTIFQNLFLIPRTLGFLTSDFLTYDL